MPRTPAFGSFLALLAVMAQLAFGAVMPDPDIALVLEHAGPICHAPPPPGTPAMPSHHRRLPNCPMCPLCASLTTPAIILPGTGPTVPAPQTLVFQRPGLPPPATAPPATAFHAAQPRAPPALA